MDKAFLRKTKLSERMAMDETRHREDSARILATLAPYIASGIVATYAPVMKEVDVTALLPRENICLPVMVKNSKLLTFKKPEMEFFKKNAFGILEPHDAAKICQPTVVIVPMLAFDRRGFRIGYGGGYYDHTLAELRAHTKITAIGLAFSFQEVAAIPNEAFDVRLDKIITEKEVLEFGGA